MILRPFQREFIRNAVRPDADVSALSLPRGNGKSWLAGHLVSRILDPADPLFRPGTESVLLAASIEQARIVFRFARETLEPMGGYRFLDSATRVAITHTASHTRLRVIGSNGQTAMGLVNTPWAIADEPGSWAINGGQLMWDALTTAMGKPGSPLKILLIGTLAPLGVPGHWWHSLVSNGSHGSTYVMRKQGDHKTWSNWHTIRKANPLTSISANFRRKLIEERDAALLDSRLKARFLSYRLNVPSGDDSTMMLAVSDWERVLQRPVALPAGAPIVGIDLGAGRSWSAATAVWQSGRMEAIAIAPGIPDIRAQEKRDKVPAGVYQALADSGRLRIAEGLRVPSPSMLIDAVRDTWGTPASIICDRFRLGELRDAQPNCQIIPRVSRWSESSEDIRAIRKMAADGPLSVCGPSRDLLTASFSAAMVANDDAGNVRPVKRSNNVARDDVAIAAMLACGHWLRSSGKPTGGFRYLGAA